MAGLAVLAAGAVALGAVSIAGVASAQTPPTDGQNRRGQFQEMLAQKLGVTADQLRNATKETRDQLIDQAVAAGRITKAEGDRLKNAGPFSGRTGPRVARGQGQNQPGLRGELRAGFTNVIETVAGSFGMTTQQLRDELKTKSIADIAREHGRTTDQIKNTIMTQVKADVQNAVSGGKLSQRQADLMLRGLDRVVDRIVSAKPGQRGAGFGQLGPRQGNPGPRGPMGPMGPMAPQGPRSQ
jgi:hypothetical protein